MENRELTAALAVMDEGLGNFFSRLQGLTTEQGQARSPEGGWSIAQIVQHVALTEERWRMKNFCAMEHGETGEGIVQPPTQIVAPKMMVDRSVKRQAPVDLEPEAGVTLEEAVAALRTVREKLRETILLCPPQAQYLHYRYGMLPLAQWVGQIVGGHMERHQGQIEEILAKHRSL